MLYLSECTYTVRYFISGVLSIDELVCFMLNKKDTHVCGVVALSLTIALHFDLDRYPYSGTGI